MYNQKIPGYTDKFKDAPWLVEATEHYCFHYFTHSLAENELQEIKEGQEAVFLKILDFLELPPPNKKILYYLYPDPVTKQDLMGNAWFAQTIYNDFSIHALYSESDRVVGPHEDTHLLSLPLGLSIGFLQEGLAEHMVGHDWYGNTFKKVLVEAFENANFKVSKELLTSHEAWVATEENMAREYYSLAAMFTSYLIEKYGKETYLNLYKRLGREMTIQQNTEVYEDLFPVSIEEIWVAFLDQIKEV